MTRQTSDFRAKRLLATASNRDITFEQIAEYLNMTKDQLKRRIRNWNWKMTEVMKLMELFQITWNHAVMLFYRPVDENILTFEGIPYPTRAFDFVAESTMDNGVIVRRRTHIEFEVLA